MKRLWTEWKSGSKIHHEGHEDRKGAWSPGPPPAVTCSRFRFRPSRKTSRLDPTRAIAESLEIAFREQEDDLTKRLMTKQDGAEIKAEIIKWMFLFWIGQLAATVAIVKFLIH